MPFKTTEAKRQYDRERYLANRGTIRIHQAMRRVDGGKLTKDVDNAYRRARRNTIRKLIDTFKGTGLWTIMDPAERNTMERMSR